jgi:hypothetical protein
MPQMMMSPRVRTLALTAHVAISVGWLGAAASFLALAVAELTGQDAQTARAALLAMELTGWYAIVPLCLASLVTGLVMALGTHWGLLRHYWVLAKLLIAVASTVILLQFMGELGAFRELVADPTLSIETLRSSDPVRHSSLGVLALLVATVLAEYKPWGTTPYGRRRQLERRAASEP